MLNEFEHSKYFLSLASHTVENDGTYYLKTAMTGA